MTRPFRQLMVIDGLRALSAASDLLDAAVAEHFAIGRTDLRCLDVLAHDGPLPAGQLGHAVGLSSGALSIAVDRLERAGYAQRLADPGDRRRVLVALAPAAEPVVALFHELHEPVERQLASYSEAELDLLDRFLRAISHTLTEQARAILQRTSVRA